MRSLPDIVFKRTSRITSLTASLLLQSYVSAHSILSHVCSKIFSRSLQIIIWQCLASLSYSITDIFSKETPSALVYQRIKPKAEKLSKEFIIIGQEAKI